MAARGQASLQRRLQSSQEAQCRQAVLVRKLQAKGRQYRAELEQQLEAGGGFLPGRWEATGDHRLEKALLQLEEERQRCEDLAEVNAVLREQLEQANAVNSALREDVGKLTADWVRAREELERKESEWRKERELYDHYVRDGRNRLLSLWCQVVTFHRRFLEMKTATDRDLSELKAEQMRLSGAILVTCSCLNSGEQVCESLSLGRPVQAEQQGEQEIRPKSLEVACSQDKGDLEEELQDRVTELSALLGQCQKQSEEKEKTMKTLNNSVEIPGRALAEVSEEKELLAQEKAALEERLAAMERDRQGLSEQLAEARSVKETLESSLFEAQQHLRQLEIARSQLEIQLQTVTQAKEAVQGVLKCLQCELEAERSLTRQERENMGQELLRKEQQYDDALRLQQTEHEVELNKLLQDLASEREGRHSDLREVLEQWEEEKAEADREHEKKLFDMKQQVAALQAQQEEERTRVENAKQELLLEKEREKDAVLEMLLQTQGELTEACQQLRQLRQEVEEQQEKEQNIAEELQAELQEAQGEIMAVEKRHEEEIQTIREEMNILLQQREALQKQVEELTSQLAASEESVKKGAVTLHQEVASLTRKLESAQKQRKDVLHKRDRLQAVKEKLVWEVKLLRESVTASETRAHTATDVNHCLEQELQATLCVLKLKNEEVEAQWEKIQMLQRDAAEVEALQETLTHVTAILTEREGEMKLQQERMRMLEKQKEMHKTTLDQVVKDITEKNEKIQSQQEQIRELEKQREGQRTAVSQMRQELEERDREIQLQEGKIMSSASQVRNLLVDLDCVKADLREKNVELVSLTQQMHELEMEREEVKSLRASLEHVRAVLRDTESERDSQRDQLRLLQLYKEQQEGHLQELHDKIEKMALSLSEEDQGFESQHKQTQEAEEAMAMQLRTVREQLQQTLETLKEKDRLLDIQKEQARSYEEKTEARMNVLQRDLEHTEAILKEKDFTIESQKELLETFHKREQDSEQQKAILQHLEVALQEHEQEMLSLQSLISERDTEWFHLQQATAEREQLSWLSEKRLLSQWLEHLLQAVARLECEKVELKQLIAELRRTLEEVERERRRLKRYFKRRSLPDACGLSLSHQHKVPASRQDSSHACCRCPLAELWNQVSLLQMQMQLAEEQRYQQDGVECCAKTMQELSHLHQELSCSLAAVVREPKAAVLEAETQKLDRSLNDLSLRLEEQLRHHGDSSTTCMSSQKKKPVHTRAQDKEQKPPECAMMFCGGKWGCICPARLWKHLLVTVRMNLFFMKEILRDCSVSPSAQKAPVLSRMICFLRGCCDSRPEAQLGGRQQGTSNKAEPFHRQSEPLSAQAAPVHGHTDLGDLTFVVKELPGPRLQDPIHVCLLFILDWNCCCAGSRGLKLELFAATIWNSINSKFLVPDLGKGFCLRKRGKDQSRGAAPAAGPVRRRARLASGAMAARGQASLQRRLQSSQEAQCRQAVLVRKLQAKGRQYRAELEQQLEAGGGFLPGRWEATGDHRLEKALLQLEEERQRCEGLAEVNAVLREQLEQANAVNSALREDVGKLTADWVRAREELERKESEWRKERELYDNYVRDGRNRLLSLWCQVVTFHRRFLEMKTATDRDLSELKAEQMRLSGAILVTCSCLNSGEQVCESLSLGRPVQAEQQGEQEIRPKSLEVACSQDKGDLEEELQDRVTELSALFGQCQKQNEEKEKTMKTLNNSVEIPGRALAEVSEEKELLAQEKAALEERLAAMERDRQGLSEQLAEARSVKETLESSLFEAQQHLRQLEIARSQLEIQLQTVTQAKEAVQGVLKCLQCELEAERSLTRQERENMGQELLRTEQQYDDALRLQQTEHEVELNKLLQDLASEREGRHSDLREVLEQWEEEKAEADREHEKKLFDMKQQVAALQAQQEEERTRVENAKQELLLEKEREKDAVLEMLLQTQGELTEACQQLRQLRQEVEEQQEKEQNIAEELQAELQEAQGEITAVEKRHEEEIQTIREEMNILLQQREALQKQVEELTSQLAASEESVKKGAVTLHQEVASLTRKLVSAQKQRKDVLHKRDRLQAVKEKLVWEVKLLRESVTASETRAHTATDVNHCLEQELQATLCVLKLKNEEVEAQWEKIQMLQRDAAEVEALQETLTHVTAILTEREGEMKLQQERMRMLEKQKEMHKTTLDQVVKDITEKNEKIQSQQEQIRELEKQREGQRTAVSQMRQELEERDREIQLQEGKIMSSASQVRNLLVDLDCVKADLREKNVELVSLTQQMHELEMEREEVKSLRASLEHVRAVLRDTESERDSQRDQLRLLQLYKEQQEGHLQELHDKIEKMALSLSEEDQGFESQHKQTQEAEEAMAMQLRTVREQLQQTLETLEEKDRLLDIQKEQARSYEEKTEARMNVLQRDLEHTEAILKEKDFTIESQKELLETFHKREQDSEQQKAILQHLEVALQEHEQEMLSLQSLISERDTEWFHLQQATAEREQLSWLSEKRLLSQWLEHLLQAVARLECEKVELKQLIAELRRTLEEVERERRRLKRYFKRRSLPDACGLSLSHQHKVPASRQDLSHACCRCPLAELWNQVSLLQMQMQLAEEQRYQQDGVECCAKTMQELSHLHQELSCSLAAVVREPKAAVLEAETQKLDRSLNDLSLRLEEQLRHHGDSSTTCMSSQKKKPVHTRAQDKEQKPPECAMMFCGGKWGCICPARLWKHLLVTVRMNLFFMKEILRDCSVSPSAQKAPVLSRMICFLRGCCDSRPEAQLGGRQQGTSNKAEPFHRQSEPLSAQAAPVHGHTDLGDLTFVVKELPGPRLQDPIHVCLLFILDWNCCCAGSRGLKLELFAATIWNSINSKFLVPDLGKGFCLRKRGKDQSRGAAPAAGPVRRRARLASGAMAARGQASLQRRLQSSQEAQCRQAVLVRKLQAKGRQYRAELEQQLEAGGGFLPGRWEATGDHRLEKVLLQLEEERQRCEGLAEVNAVLREQLEQANAVNSALREDVGKLTADWVRAREELERKESEWRKERELYDNYVRDGRNRLLSLWCQVVTFHRRFLEMKTATDRDLSELKAEQMRLSGAILVTCSCLNSGEQVCESLSLGRPVQAEQQGEQEIRPKSLEVACSQDKGDLEEELQDRVTELSALFGQCQKQNEEKEKTMKTLNNSVEIPGRALAEVSEEKELLAQEKAALEERLAAMERDRQGLSEQLAEARSVKETLESSLFEAQQHLRQLEIARSQLEIQLQTVTQAKEAVQGVLKCLQCELEAERSLTRQERENMGQELLRTEQQYDDALRLQQTEHEVELNKLLQDLASEREGRHSDLREVLEQWEEEKAEADREHEKKLFDMKQQVAALQAQQEEERTRVENAKQELLLEKEREKDAVLEMLLQTQGELTEACQQLRQLRQEVEEQQEKEQNIAEELQAELQEAQGEITAVEKRHEEEIQTIREEMNILLQQREALQKQVEELTSQLAASEESVKKGAVTLHQEVASLTRKLVSAQKQRKDVLHKRDRLQAVKEKLVWEVKLLRESVTASETRAHTATDVNHCLEQELQATLCVLKLKNEEVEAQWEKIQMLQRDAAEVEALQETLTHVTAILTEREGEMKLQQERMRMLEKQKEMHKTTLDQVVKDITEKNEKIQSQQEQIRELEKQREGQRTAVSQMRQELEERDREIQLQEGKIMSSASQVRNLLVDLDCVKADLREKNVELVSLTQQMHELEMEREEVKSLRASLEHVRAVLRDTESERDSQRDQLRLLQLYKEQQEGHLQELHDKIEKMALSLSEEDQGFESQHKQTQEAEEAMAMQLRTVREQLQQTLETLEEKDRLLDIQKEQARSYEEKTEARMNVLQRDLEHTEAILKEKDFTIESQKELLETFHKREQDSEQQKAILQHLEVALQEHEQEMLSLQSLISERDTEWFHLQQATAEREQLSWLSEKRLLSQWLEHLLQAVARLECEKVELKQLIAELRRTLEEVERERRRLKRYFKRRSLPDACGLSLSHQHKVPASRQDLSHACCRCPLAELWNQVSLLQMQMQLAEEQRYQQDGVECCAKTMQELSHLHQELSCSLAAVVREPKAAVLEAETQKLDRSLNDLSLRLEEQLRHHGDSSTTCMSSQKKKPVHTRAQDKEQKPPV
ncbi:uncharacterized protein O9250_009183 [Rhynochetos jubatus]